MNSFTIGGVVVILDAAAKWDQQYRQKSTGVDHATGDGGTIRQALLGAVGKLRTTITGEGFTPIGLAGLDYTQPLVIKCAKPRIAADTDTTVTIPAARRTDDAPAGFAIVAGEQVSTTIISIVANVATLTAVGSATAYQVEYIPELTVYADLEEGFSTDTGRHTWTLNCVEV